ncbi:MAG: hypothetical protein H6696_06320 [Deferribacteres bacterium]|nr:hypothetical protein [candidate division KSB1 bacterium]MCB9501534.1 hypothetical protein [Deferribacteres bacterium]
MRFPRYFFIFILVFGFTSSTGHCGEFAKHLAQKRFQLSSQTAQQDESNLTKHQHALKAFALSALIPGAGQLYNKNHYRAIGFVSFEILGVFYYINQNNEGKDLENVYEAYADEHWIEDRYWDALATASGEDRDDMEALRTYESGRWSHHLPEWRNQTYYENIGKYDQFNSGWDDAQSDFGRDSQLREDYTFMRKDSNDAFKRAGTAISLVILNHLVSALEAGYSAGRQSNELQASLGFIPQRTVANNYVPALSMRILW